MMKIVKIMRKLGKRLFRFTLIVIALYGGWIAAGMLNDNRDDVPRPIPTSRPSATTR
jgi:hypothetical protein